MLACLVNCFNDSETLREDLECLAAASPHLVSMMLAPEGDPDALDILTPRSYAEAIEGPYSSQWQEAMDAEMASWKVKRPPGSPPAFKARYVARGFSQRQGVDFFQTFSPTPKMTTLWEIWLRCPPGFTGSFPAGTQWSLRRPVYGLRQASREWHDTLRTTLAALGFAPSTADPSLFLRTDATLPLFYVLVYVDNLVFATGDTEALAHVLQRFDFTYSSPQSTPLPTGHSLSAPPSDESVEPSGLYPELVGCLITLGMGLVLGGRARVVLTGHADASWVDDLATQRSSQGYTFSLGSGSVSQLKDKAKEDAGNGTGGELVRGRIMNKGEQSSGETRRSEERRAAAPRRKEGRAGQARAGGDAETWVDQRQETGSACHECVAGTVEERATTGPPEGSASLTGTGAGRGVRVVLSRKKMRDSPESNVKVKDSNSRHKQLCPVKALDVVTKLSTLGVVKAGEAAVLSVKLPACQARTDTRANDIREGPPRRGPGLPPPIPPPPLPPLPPLPPPPPPGPTAATTSTASTTSTGKGGGKGGGGAPLKEGRARSATSSTNSNCTSLSCEEMLFEEVN
ncbi:unnamed protein product, partial [Closterium sp. NIES-53]